jgi:TrmH family RNA methyltransferase
MISQKLVKKLADKKYRVETGLFFVEGRKSIFELLDSDFDIVAIYGTSDFILAIEKQLLSLKKEVAGVIQSCISVTEETLVKIGTLKSNNAGIAIAVQKKKVSLEHILDVAKTDIVLVLDDVHDPGNLGSIIRTADWFGVTHMVTSETTADLYNPKTIAATVGSFTRVSVTSLALSEFLESVREHGIPIMGALLDGKNIFDSKTAKHGVLVMGSESHGINDELKQYISDAVTIPRFGNAESLNVSVATAVLLAELRRVHI